MKYKTFRGNSTRQVMAMARAELGADAMVLETRNALDAAGFPMIEMVVTIDGPPNESRRGNPRPALPGMPSFDDLAMLVLCDGVAGADSEVLMQRLLASCVRPSIAQQLLSDAQAELSGETATKTSAGSVNDTRRILPQGLGMEARLRARMATALGASLNINRNGTRILAFVGPTGVGKTTTAAKLAARLGTVDGARVGLVAADPYRVGAVEQLSIFAELLGLPVRVAATPSELKRVVGELRHCDWILVDTQGRSPREAARDVDWAGLIATSSWIEPVLVLAANTSEADLDAAADAFSSYAPKCLAFTKIDEAQSLGSILNQAVRTSLPVGLVTNGQRVPQDLIMTTGDGIASLVLDGAAA